MSTPGPDADRAGSELGGAPVGPGGFIDIAQNARKVVFCGTFDAKGSKLDIGGGRLTVVAPGAVRKLVGSVDQITFSGRQALKRDQDVWCVTERDVLAHMDFRPEIAEPISGTPALCFE